jgi:hypothetical protein
LEVGDLPLPVRDHLEPLEPSPTVVQPPRGADDLVVSDLREVRLDNRRATAELPDLELQDLTGLVRAASSRRELPPEVTARDAPPLDVVGH